MIAVAALLVCAGCLGTGTTDDHEASLVVRVVPSAPDDATVTAYDDATVQQSEVLTTAVENATDGDRTEVTVPLTEREAESVRDVIDSLPTYEDAADAGTYLRRGNTTVVVMFQKRQ